MPFVFGPRSTPLVLGPRSSSHRPTSERRYPHRTGFRSKRCPVVDDEPLFILPLMHHLVQERVHGLVPAISTDVAPADDDLGLATFCGRAIVTPSAAHTPGEADGNLAQLTTEALVVVRTVQLRQLSN